MANFVPKSVVKSAVREIAVPLTKAEHVAVVDDILTSNPFGTTGYVVGGVSHEGVELSKEYYTARFIYENGEAETVATLSAKCPTVAAYDAAVTAINADTAIKAAMGTGLTTVHETDTDTFSATIKCHDENGELYNVAISRTQVTVTGYEADAILTAVEAWADAVPTLA